LHAGQKIKEIRSHLGISMREVEEYSRQIARAEGNQKFCISCAWLSEIETTGSVPSVQKLFSLSAIYRHGFVEFLHLFGIDLDKISLHQQKMPLRKTHLANLRVYDEGRTITFPVRLDRGFKLGNTTLLSGMVKLWDEVPISVIRHLDITHQEYGYIGLKDLTMDPLVPPGSFVQIDGRAREVHDSSWRTEFDRPIYFIKLRLGYVCSWCELKTNQLTLLPHPLSRCRIRQFAYPSEAQIVGRVTGIAMRVVRPGKRASADSLRSSKQPSRSTKITEPQAHRSPKEP
jgi:transcriptional regulator with XRE-family HTH domain